MINLRFLELQTILPFALGDVLLGGEQPEFSGDGEVAYRNVECLVYFIGVGHLFLKTRFVSHIFHRRWADLHHFTDCELPECLDALVQALCFLANFVPEFGNGTLGLF